MSAGIIAAVVVAGVVIIGLVTRASGEAQLKDWTRDQAVPTVALVTPAGDGKGGTLDLPGRLEAYSRAPLYARVSGYLKSWTADIGTPVKAGQLLAEIETPDLDQQLLQAKADLASAQANAALASTTAKRWQAMQGSDSVSKQEVDEENRRLQHQAGAGEGGAGQCRPRAGAEGIHAHRGALRRRRHCARHRHRRLINVGGAVGQELFVVSDTKKLRVYVNVPPELRALDSGRHQGLHTVPEHPNKTYMATVESSSQSVNVASRQHLDAARRRQRQRRVAAGRIRQRLSRSAAQCDVAEHSCQCVDVQQVPACTSPPSAPTTRCC